MRIALLLMLVTMASSAQQLPAMTQLAVHAGGPLAELGCEKSAPAARPAAPVNPDPLEMPSDALLAEARASADLPRLAQATPPQRGFVPGAAGFRIAIWGDSHLAANFFTEELARLMTMPDDALPNLLLPASMGRAGVRLPLRKACVSAQWKYEAGYLGGAYAAAPGPGLVNLYSEQAGATLAWDVRKHSSARGYQRVRILYQQTEAPMVVGISVDGAVEQTVTLHRAPGPAVLELAGDAPIAQVRLRLIDARFRFHGLELWSAQSTPFVLDVFGYPGATVAGWKSADPAYLGAWFAQRPYQLVMLEYGTNEGNVKPFDLATYRQTLTQSVRTMRALFPAAECMLIAPGDRGVLVRHSANGPAKIRGPITRAMWRAAALEAFTKRSAMRTIAPAPDLYYFSTIHAAIGRVQAQVAADAGCRAWSMQDAMGGAGSAYAWARATPPLMARDLTHFTVAGYRRLAQQFARDMGWSAAAAP